MGIVNKILGQGQQATSPNEYTELDLEQYEGEIEVPDVDTEIHIAEIRGQEGVMDVKDLVYDGDMVIADLSYFKTAESKIEHIIDEFRQVTDEVGGDIVQRGEDQLIIAPRGMRISREKISR